MKNVEKIKILKEVIKRIDKDEFAVIYTSITYVLYYLYNKDWSIEKVQRVFKLLPFKDPSLYDYWWPRTQEYKAVRIDVLKNRIEYFSLPWYKRIFKS